jgi:MFS transporter, UMF1 family
MPAAADPARTSPAARLAWTLFEFGGGPYFVVLTVFVFPAYFANHVVVNDAVTGQAYWGYVTGAAGFLVALASPPVGAIADRYGPRKPGLALFGLLSTLPMCAVWFVHPGGILTGALCIVLASVLLELAFVFHNAMLPAIAPQNRLGIISAAGYAMSYAGALTGFALSLGVLPLIGFAGGAENGFANERANGVLAAILLVAGAVPLLLLTPDTPRGALSLGACVAGGFAGLARTIRRAGAYRNVVLYLFARMIYYDGLTAVFAFVSIFASGVFAWRNGEEQVYGALIILTAAVSALAGGWADDRFGSKRTIQFSLVFFSLGLFANFGTDPGTIAWVFAAGSAPVPLIGPVLAALGFETQPEQVFVAVGIFSGLFVGPALSSSRTFMARLAPQGQVAEFFGLYNLTGRATAFVAPALIGVVTQASGSQLIGLMTIFGFIAAGFLLLWFVKEPWR